MLHDRQDSRLLMAYRYWRRDRESPSCQEEKSGRKLNYKLMHDLNGIRDYFCFKIPTKGRNPYCLTMPLTPGLSVNNKEHFIIWVFQTTKKRNVVKKIDHLLFLVLISREGLTERYAVIVFSLLLHVRALMSWGRNECHYNDTHLYVGSRQYMLLTLENNEEETLRDSYTKTFTKSEKRRKDSERSHQINRTLVSVKGHRFSEGKWKSFKMNIACESDHVKFVKTCNFSSKFYSKRC